MIPANLTDDELLRHYDELFRQHAATAELAERMRGGSAARVIEDELEEARMEIGALETQLDDMRAQREALAEALEDYLDDTSAANAKAARKVLDGIK